MLEVLCVGDGDKGTVRESRELRRRLGTGVVGGVRGAPGGVRPAEGSVLVGAGRFDAKDDGERNGAT